jgi:hypothetical protein
MIKVKLHHFTFLLVIIPSLCLLCPSDAAIAAPRLFFSDLDSGPKSGWEGSATKGGGITVWGKDFGSARENSYITVNGSKLASDSDYAEWGVTGTSNGIPRGLERITFWLNSSCSNGAGTISVTVSGVTSNTLPFTVRKGNIYFIDVKTGSDTANGRKSTRQGRNNRPWKSPRMALHGNSSAVSAGDIIYIRDGTYSKKTVTMDDEDAFMRCRDPGDKGKAGNPLAIVGYPGEWPLFDMTDVGRGIFSQEQGHLGRTGADYVTLGKFKVTNGRSVFAVWGIGCRVIGNWLYNCNTGIWSGLFMIDTSEYTYIYGNYFDYCGYDPYMHNIYIKTHKNTAIGTMIECKYTYVGWNEFYNAQCGLNPSQRARGGTIEIQTESDAAALGRHTRYTYIHDNYFHGGNCHNIYGGSNSTYIYNNIFSETTCPNGGFQFDTLDGDSKIYNNTFYYVGDAAAPMFYLNVSVNASWKNNIFYARPGQTYVTAESPAQFTSDCDLFYGNGSPSCGQCTITHAVVADPKFVSAGLNFHQQVSSPTIDAGSSDARSIVPKDFDYNRRPQGSGYDIGAFEYDK